MHGDQSETVFVTCHIFASGDIYLLFIMDIVHIVYIKFNKTNNNKITKNSETNDNDNDRRLGLKQWPTSPITIQQNKSSIGIE